MSPRDTFALKSFRIALAISLLLHGLLLFYHYFLPSLKIPLEPRPQESESPRLSATLIMPRTPAPLPQHVEPPQNPAPRPAPRPVPKQLIAPSQAPSVPTWSVRERNEMEKFLEQTPRAPQPPQPPRTGRELAQLALIIAGQVSRQLKDEDIGRENLNRSNSSGKAIEPLSLEMYISAFLEKMNRGANFIKSTPRIRGQHYGEVQITISSDGSIKNFRILQTGDQQTEIDYIKSVLEVSAPFSAFPPDLKETMDTLSIPICINPRFAGEGGRMFSRSGTKECAA